MRLFDKRRQQPEFRHEDPKVRRAAVGRLEDPSLLVEIVRNDPDGRVREEATGVLHGLALEGVPEAALAALEGLGERRHLVSVARSALHETVSRAALSRLDDAKALGSVARHSRHPAVRLEAVGRISEPAELGAVAQRSDHSDVALTALERIASLRQSDLLDAASMTEVLTAVSQRARSRAAGRRARSLLRAGEPEPPESPSVRRSTDRRRQIQLCEAMESLAFAEGSRRLAADISQIKDAWIDLVPEVDEDLQERLDRALASARERLARNRADLEEHHRLERARTEFFEKQLAPRIALCEQVESSPGEQAGGRLDEARWEWERLAPSESEEVRALGQRFEAACAAGEQRQRAWEEERAAARVRAEREAAREERERRLAANRQRLERLCVRLERLLATERPGLKQAARGLSEIESALRDPGRFASRREEAAQVKRLRAIHAALYPKVAELRDGEEWRRWANAGIQEELCARAEALREVGSPLEAAHRLTGIQEEWRKASTVSREKSLQLWVRFKAARDEVRARLESYRAGEIARKEALCVRAEELAGSTDWIRTAEALQGLQAEWKALGPARRAQDRALWERFRRACDEFFTHRKTDLRRRREEWARNLEAKKALCVRAEALTDSTDWTAAAVAMKQLQAEWKAIGPVSRRRSEALWRRFRGACDHFFERYKRRDAIEREARLAERETILRELEALLLEEPSPPGGLVEALESVRKRWQASAALEERQAAELEARFEAALGRVIAAFPEAIRETEWDAERNRGRLEELCARVERLFGEQDGVNESAVSPAARLAALWVERMAANTIGGGIGDEARWRAAAEEVRKAQAVWQRIGYVPGTIRRGLTERFERACRRVSEQHERGRAAPAPKSGESHKG